MKYDFTSVKSSTISGYTGDGEDLIIKFNSGTVYRYTDVDSMTLTNFSLASSKGTFFHDNIRNKFDYTKISDEEKETETTTDNV